jgi:hypothetical protein
VFNYVINIIINNYASECLETGVKLLILMPDYICA